MRFTLILMLISSLIFGCSSLRTGNPSLLYSLSPINLKSINKKENRVILTPPSQLILYRKNRVKLYMQVITSAQAFEYASKKSVNQSYSDNSRVPPLTYILFRVINESEKAVKFDLMSSTFTDKMKVVYSAVKKESYKQLFTSVSYKFSTYSLLFSPYVVKRDNIEPKKNPYFNSLPIDKPVSIAPKEEIQQMVGYKKFNTNSKSLLFKATLFGEKFRIPFNMVTTRSDKNRR